MQNHAKIEYSYHLESASQHGHMATRLGRWAMCCSLSCFGRRYVVIQPGGQVVEIFTWKSGVPWRFYRNPTYNRPQQ